MFGLADFVTWGNALWAIGTTLTGLAGLLAWLYGDAIRSRLSPHVESTLDLLARKTSGRLGLLGRLLQKPVPPAPGETHPALASRRNPAPPPGWHDWIEGEIPALGLRARWVWGQDGAKAEPLCPYCNARLQLRATGAMASGDPPRTGISCPAGHFSKEWYGTPDEYMSSLDREIVRMKDSGEWARAHRPG